MRLPKNFLLKPLFTSAAFLTLIACGQDGASDLKVTNGSSISEQNYPAVVLLVMVKPEGQGLCTGTFVNDHQVVTAGHCVEGLDPVAPSLYFMKDFDSDRRSGVRALSFHRNPLYSMNDNSGVNPHDLSVVTFPKGSAPAVAELGTNTPAVGSELTIVGYGNNRNFISDTGSLSGSGAGHKRIGRNSLASNSDGLLVFHGVTDSSAALSEGEMSSAGSGDSGGPLFVAGKLVGVTSGGGLMRNDKMLVAESRYVDLNSDEARAFLKQELH